MDATDHTGKPDFVRPEALGPRLANEPAVRAKSQMQGPTQEGSGVNMQWPVSTPMGSTPGVDRLWEALELIIEELRGLRAGLQESLARETPLTRQEAAEYLKVHPDTLFRWAREGKVKYARLGNAMRFKKLDLDDFMERESVPAEKELRTWAKHQVTR